MTILKDVLWTDESSVQLQCYKRFCCRKKGKQPLPKSRAKHSIKVHVWAGIGWHGATEICIIDGIMDAAMYVRILQVALQPTLQRPQYEKGHRFMWRPGLVGLDTFLPPPLFVLTVFLLLSLVNLVGSPLYI